MAAKVTSAGEYANSLLKLIFNATAYANMADNAASAPLTNLYVSLHTASPGATGLQTTNEAAYTGYARVAVARTSGGWTVSTNTVYPVANLTFPSATAGSETETFLGIGTAPSGSGATVTFTATAGAITSVTTTPVAGGTGYPASATIYLNVTGGGGTGGIVSATTNASGVVTSFSATQVAGGSGYTSTVGAATSTGTQHLLYFGAISPTIPVSTGVAPIIVGGTGESLLTET